MHDRTLLITQSPIDVVYILQLYIKEIDKSKVTIACIGSRGVHKYLSKLNLKCELIFIQPVFYSKNRIKYLNSLRIQASFIGIFCQQWREVYFSSIYQDIYTMSIINECQKNDIKLYRISTGLDNLEKYSVPMKIVSKMAAAVIAKLVKWATGVEIKLILLSGKFIYCYKNSGSISTVRIAVGEEIYQLFGVEVSGVSSDNILLFESRGEEAGCFTSYQSDLAELLDKLTLLGTVYIKPHPTHGASKLLESDTRVKMLDESMPAIMINLTNFAMIVGIESAALKEVRHTNVISVIDSFTFASDAVKLNFKSYLKDDSRSEIQFKLIEQLELDCLIPESVI